MSSSFFRRNNSQVADYSGLSIGIQLDKDMPTVFYPGCRVAGRLSMSNSTSTSSSSSSAVAPAFVEKLDISLFGRTVTSTHRSFSRGADESSTTVWYRGDEDLFRQTSTTEHIHLPPHQAVFTTAFEFVFPLRSQPYPGGSPPTDPTWLTRPHDLPPSFRVGAHEFAQVAYGVEALVHLLGRAEPVKHQLGLDFACFSQQWPSIIPVYPIDKSYQFASRALVGETPSFFDKVVDKMSSETPRIDFSLRATIPTHLVVSATPFPVHGSLVIDRLSSGKIDVPSVTVRLRKIKLSSLLHYRGVIDPSSYVGVGSYSGEGANTIKDSVELEVTPREMEVEVDGKKREKEKVFEYPFSFQVIVPPSACPTFNTFNIKYSHSLKMAAEVVIFGKKFELETQVPVTVLSPLTGPSEIGGGASSQDDLVEPPPYEFEEDSKKNQASA